jgi:CheY-like chemotaxis protein
MVRSDNAGQGLGRPKKVSGSAPFENAGDIMEDLNVLIVDDDEVLLDLVGRRLRRLGFDPDRADNGKAGIELINQNDYDLIVTDIYMPEATGIDLLKAAKKKDPRIQVIVITGGATFELALDALDLGAFAYLTKPFDHLKAFDHAIVRAVKFRRLLEEEHQRENGDFIPGGSLDESMDDELKLLKRGNDELHSMIRIIPAALFVFEEAGEVVMANPSAERLVGIGWDSREAGLQSLKTLIANDEPDSMVSLATKIGPWKGRVIRLPERHGSCRSVICLEPSRADSPERIDFDQQVDHSLRNLKRGLAWMYKQDSHPDHRKTILKLADEIQRLEAAIGPVPGQSFAA